MRITLANAADILKNGGVVAVPTETVYGLAASFDNIHAVESIFALKGRPSNNPLIIHLACSRDLSRFCDIESQSLRLLDKSFWPGPMTLVLPIKADVIPSRVRAGLSTAAFRVPQHPVALKLLQLTGPLVMPSANLSGRPSATTSHHVEEDFGFDFPVLEGGGCDKGVESTVLIYDSGRWSIIRQGALTAESFRDVLGYTPEIKTTNKESPLCPGQLHRHYAPRAKLQLVTVFTPEMNGLVLGFKERKYPKNLTVICMGSLDSPEGVAENLYKTLRELDSENIESARVDYDLPSGGLWQTIAERLGKAAEEK